MEVAYSPAALEHISYWKMSGNLKIQERITNLIDDIKQHPFTGIGKPEPLKYELAGKWSRRINSEHRMVYTVTDNCIYVYALKGHY